MSYQVGRPRATCDNCTNEIEWSEAHVKLVSEDTHLSSEDYEVLCKRCRRIARYPDQKNFPEKLRLLATWFDREQSSGRWRHGRTDVQTDLRRIAEILEQFRESEDHLTSAEFEIRMALKAIKGLIE